MLPGPVLLPMESSIQVGTILEFWFWRNNIFPAFPVIPKKPIYHQTAFPPKSSAKVGSSRNFEITFASRPDPATNREVHTSWNNFGALVLERQYFPCFPRHPEVPNLSSHYLPTETVRKSRILKEFWKCFCSDTQLCRQWRGPYKLEQFWSFGSGEIIFSLLYP